MVGNSKFVGGFKVGLQKNVLAHSSAFSLEKLTIEPSWEEQKLYKLLFKYLVSVQNVELLLVSNKIACAC